MRRIMMAHIAEVKPHVFAISSTFHREPEEMEFDFSPSRDMQIRQTGDSKLPRGVNVRV